MTVNRDYKTDTKYGENYFDNCERMAKGDATTGSDGRKVGPDGIVLEKFKSITSIPHGPMASAVDHSKK